MKILIVYLYSNFIIPIIITHYTFNNAKQIATINNLVLFKSILTSFEHIIKQSQLIFFYMGIFLRNGQNTIPIQS